MPCTAMFLDCLIIRLLWLHHMQRLANVTMATTAFNLLKGKNDIKEVMLPWQPQLVVYCKAKRPKGVAGFKYKLCVDIF
jgi:hypothetical protein